MFHSLSLCIYLQRIWEKDSKNSLIGPAAAAAKSLQSCPTLCNPIDGSPPGFPIPGILQALLCPKYLMQSGIISAPDVCH